MTAPLRGPRGRYEVALDIACTDGGQPRRRHVSTGEPAGSPGASGYRILVDGVCSLLLVAGESGLTARDLLVQSDEATITAIVTALEGAPDWLPAESRCLLFQGDRRAARDFTERYIPLDSLTAGASAAPSLEQLAVAVGRSIARANSRLSRGTSPGGVALVSGVTIRVALQGTDVQGGRVLVAPTGGAAGGGAPGDGMQFVELTLTTVPPALDGAEEPVSMMATPQGALTARTQGAFVPAPGRSGAEQGNGGGGL